MSSGSTSLEKAAREVIDSGGAVLGVPSDPRQLDMLRGDDGKLASNVFRLARQDPERAGGRGRPAGSRNKRSDSLAKLIAHKYGDPVEFQAALYAMPLDQLCELILIADGTRERAEKLDDMLGDLSLRIRELASAAKNDGAASDSIERLAEACEALESVTRRGAGKPGDIAIKALNIQLAAAKAVSEYVHSKKPTEAAVTIKQDGVLFMPSPGAGAVASKAADMDRAQQIVADALARGEVRPEDFSRLKLIDNQFVDAEFEEVDELDHDGADAPE